MTLKAFIKGFSYISNIFCESLIKNGYRVKGYAKYFIFQSFVDKNIKQTLKRSNNISNDYKYVFISRPIAFSLVSRTIYKVLKVSISGSLLFFIGINYINYKIQVGISYFKDLFDCYTIYLKIIFEFIKQNILSKIEAFVFKILFLRDTFLKMDKFILSLCDIMVSSITSLLSFSQKQHIENCVVHDIPDNSQMVLLIKRMIEIKNILQQIKQNEKFALPNIVVIGSQSSGKSSVLEAIIGHEFLPKGTDMVTRRPIELTLVHTFGADEYGEFPDLEQKRVSFDQIQKIITDLNYHISENDYISEEPIKLNIFSSNVPDLTFIDLPGYIQVESKDQPVSLKERIIALCDKYIQEPNIILAVSAADVDLANSAALSASRRVDPDGIRTIGVITKMDLVTPERGYNILKSTNYPLKLGYVGVIPTFSFYPFDKNINLTNLIAKNEKKIFSNFQGFNNTECFGIIILRKKLVQVLESSMMHSLKNIYDSIKSELEETSYQLKAEYNDRYITPEIYMADLLNVLKYSFKGFIDNFGKPQIRLILKDILNQKVLDLLAERYWTDKSMIEWSKKSSDETYWKHKLDVSTSYLTKLGIGRLVTDLLIFVIVSEMGKLAQENQFRIHPYISQCILQSTQNILKENYYSTVKQVENSVKPYKHEIDIDESEWELGRERSLKILKNELKMCKDAFEKLRNSVGSKKLEEIVNLIINTKNGCENVGYNKSLIKKGQHAIFLRNRENILNIRLKFLKSKKCKNIVNKHYCPEIFLEIVAKKLVDIAVLFANVELLSEFAHKFPRDLDNRLVYNLTSEQLEKIAKENYETQKHIDLQQRKALLELVLEKISLLMLFERTYE
ncbi:dynamin-related GTPase MGM1 [Pneumocystis jirovecii RU7]|uniref:dynamin GTPase n=1 Tax=Pneumocystis jirovecii (strain RU7) TaxID=1408657 RepID=A0A0W4ZIK3_PNEJ7|nr:dynamin-related GTPase MGM1 [Pneumocystis jirovecii RU7]KTW28204.1 hypothetical protein T551_02623 [Pneumocystis jirovecii RU7]